MENDALENSVSSNLENLVLLQSYLSLEWALSNAETAPRLESVVYICCNAESWTWVASWDISFIWTRVLETDFDEPIPFTPHAAWHGGARTTAMRKETL